LLARLLRYAPGLFLGNMLLWAIFYSMVLVPGLVAQQFFDALTRAIPGSGAVPAAVWVLLGLLLLAGIVRMATFAASLAVFSLFEYTIHALLRKNLLGWLMTGPGSRTL